MDDARRSAQADMLANRVRKNVRHLRKWARREGVTCYRVYDRDIPEVPVAIDWYDGRLLIALYRRADRPDLDDAWLAAMVDAVASALDVARADVHIKVRERQAGRQQYDRLADRGERFVVSEGDLRFWVNLTDYLDTGLFLDHRLTRAMVRGEAAGARVLNLFCYTGSFSVYAAAGGAASTTSVDLSRTYLSWAEDNLALNGISPAAHSFLHADVLELLDDPGGPYDLVVLDPPTFSNSKRMDGVLDLVRDHVALLSRSLDALRPGGVLYFSTNARKLNLDPASIEASAVDDITQRTIPPDFDRRPHRCWRIVK